MTTPEEAFSEFVRTAANTVRSSDETRAAHLREATATWRGSITAMFAETVSATDEHGYVEAVVDLRGRLQEMKISAYAMRDLDATGLSESCLDAYRAAKTAATEAIAERFGSVFGFRPGETSFDEAIPAEMRNWPEAGEIRKAMQ